MSEKLFWFIKILIVGGMFASVCFYYPSLPEEIPIHWNYKGEVDNMANKNPAIFLLPSVALVMMILFSIISEIDPRKENYQQFKKVWQILQLILLSFFAYMLWVTLFLIAHPDKSINVFMLFGLGAIFVLIGNFMGKIKQNYFVGIKTPWTLHNEEVWNRTHRLGGWCFVFTGLIFLIEAYLNWQIGWMLVVVILLTAIIPIIYSYFLFRKINSDNSK